MTKDTFGSLIREARRRKGLSLRELARRIDVSHPYLSQLENEHNTNPSRQIVFGLAEELGLSFAYLISLTDDDLGINKHISEDLIHSLKHFDPDTVSTVAKYDYEKFEQWALQNEDFRKNPFMIEDLYEFMKQLYEVEEAAKSIAKVYMSTEKLKNEVRQRTGSVSLEFVLMDTLPITVNGRLLTEKEKRKLIKIAEILFIDEEE